MFSTYECRLVSGIPSSSSHADSDAGDMAVPAGVLQALVQVLAWRVPCRESGVVSDLSEMSEWQRRAASYAEFRPFAIPF